MIRPCRGDRVRLGVPPAVSAASLRARLEQELVINPSAAPEEREAVLVALCQHLAPAPETAAPCLLFPDAPYQAPTSWTLQPRRTRAR